jgi:hypothetical protein
MSVFVQLPEIDVGRRRLARTQQHPRLLLAVLSVVSEAAPYRRVSRSKNTNSNHGVAPPGGDIPDGTNSALL